MVDIVEPNKPMRSGWRGEIVQTFSYNGKEYTRDMTDAVNATIEAYDRVMTVFEGLSELLETMAAERKLESW